MASSPSIYISTHTRDQYQEDAQSGANVIKDKIYQKLCTAWILSPCTVITIYANVELFHAVGGQKSPDLYFTIPD